MNGDFAIFNILSNDQSFNAVSANPAQIFYDEVQQKTQQPFSIIKTDSVEPHDDDDGPSTLDWDFVYVSHLADTKAQVMEMGRTCRAALDRVAEAVYGPSLVVSCQYRTERSDSEFLLDRHLYLLEQLYKVMIRPLGRAKGENGEFVLNEQGGYVLQES